MTLRPLAALLVESVTAVQGPLPEGSTSALASEVVAAGELHRVTPALRRRVVASPDAPLGWRDPLDHARVAQLMRHMQASSDLRSARAAFDGGVRWAVAKGPVLADLVWPHPDMRSYSDIDVYVHPEDFAHALERLEGAGFDLVDRNWPEVRRSMRSELALRGPSGMLLDLHWDLVGGRDARRRIRLDLPSMIERSGERALGSGLVVPVFAGEDLVLHVAVHAALSGANRLMWLGDLYHGTRRFELDWSEMSDRARRGGALPLVSGTLARVERVFGVVLPLPGGMRRHASQSLWARRADLADRRRPFPGLPGDASLGGRRYSGARDTFLGSALASAGEAIDVRRIERRVRRRGPEANPLDADVPDRAARADYIRAITADAMA